MGVSADLGGLSSGLVNVDPGIRRSGQINRVALRTRPSGTADRLVCVCGIGGGIDCDRGLDVAAGVLDDAGETGEEGDGSDGLMRGIVLPCRDFRSFLFKGLGDEG